MQYVPFETHKAPTSSTQPLAAYSNNNSTSTRSIARSNSTDAGKDISASNSRRSLSSRFPKGATAHLDWAVLLDSFIKPTTAPTSNSLNLSSDDSTVHLSNITLSSDSQSTYPTPCDPNITPTTPGPELGTRLINSLLSHRHLTHPSNPPTLSSLATYHWRNEDGLHQVCSIDNPDTDTQCGIWADFRTRQVG